MIVLTRIMIAGICIGAGRLARRVVVIGRDNGQPQRFAERRQVIGKAQPAVEDAAK